MSRRAVRGVDPGGQDPPRTPARPALRVVSGNATPEEIAAVVAAVAAAAPDADDAGPPDADVTSTWASAAWAHRQVRASFTPGRHAWRTSFWPR